jgi:hypothetical protein
VIQLINLPELPIGNPILKDWMSNHGVDYAREWATFSLETVRRFAKTVIDEGAKA